jgi:hypothetical protein
MMAGRHPLAKRHWRLRRHGLQKTAALPVGFLDKWPAGATCCYPENRAKPPFFKFGTGCA